MEEAASEILNYSLSLVIDRCGFGEVPEWPKGTGCKPVGVAYGGSNPPLSTIIVIGFQQLADSAMFYDYFLLNAENWLLGRQLMRE